jgi:hypothetical protein
MRGLFFVVLLISLPHLLVAVVEDMTDLERSNALIHERNEMLIHRLESALQRRPSKVIENVLLQLRGVSHQTPSKTSVRILNSVKRDLVRAKRGKKRLRSSSSSYQQLFLQVSEVPDVKSLLPSAADAGVSDMVSDIADGAKQDVQDSEQIAKQNEETQALAETKEKLDAQKINADQYDEQTKSLISDTAQQSSCASQYTMCVERTEEYRRICIEAYKSTKSRTARGTRREHLKYRLELEGEYKEKYSTPEDEGEKNDDFIPGNDEDLDSTGPAPEEKEVEEDEEEEEDSGTPTSSTGGTQEEDEVMDDNEDPQTQASAMTEMQNKLMDDTIDNMNEMS